MPLSLRNLLFQVQPFRTDLTEMVCLSALQETARDVLRRAMAWEVDVTGTLSTSAATQTFTVAPITLTMDDGSTVGPIPVRPLAIRRLEIALPSTTNYRGLSKMTPYRERIMRSSVSRTGMPSEFIDDHGKALLDTIPNVAYPYKARVCIVPSDHFEAVDLPDEYRQMLASGALASLLLMPGDKRDPEGSRAYRLDFNARLAEFMADETFASGPGTLPATRLGQPIHRNWRR